MTTTSTLLRAALAAAFLGAGAGPLDGQEIDPRWLPWLGCWEPVTASSEADLLCVRPGAEAGAVEFLRVKGAAVVGREVVRADGRRHESAYGKCMGWEEGFFSRDGRRIFLRSSYTCGSEVTQEGGAILAFVSPEEWLDVRATGTGGQIAAWVQRFRPAEPALAEAAGFGDLPGEDLRSARTSRLVAGAGVDVDDVIEATARVPAEAVRAFLAEQKRPLKLSASDLLRMADSGVPGEVVDVAVAVSYPDRFTLKAQGERVALSDLDEGSLRRRGAYRGYFDPGFYDPFYAPWSFRIGFGYLAPYTWGYAPYPYGWGYGGSYWGGYTPVIVDVDRTPREQGRVIAGRGYSRGSAGGAPSPAPSPSAGASGTSPSGGYSGAGSASGSGSSTGRTAKPRGGG